VKVLVEKLFVEFLLSLEGSEMIEMEAFQNENIQECFLKFESFLDILKVVLELLKI
jgi:hypothetical protein